VQTANQVSAALTSPIIPSHVPPSDAPSSDATDTEQATGTDNTKKPKSTTAKAADVASILNEDVQKGLSYANARRARDTYNSPAQ
jgi:hypothetical protein